jgi:tetratricopeptide (TPR) repeat protein
VKGKAGFALEAKREWGSLLKSGIVFALLLLMLTTSAISQQAEDRIQQLYTAAKSEEQAHHLDAAVEKYKTILRLDPQLAAAYNNLGNLYYRQGRFDEAIPMLKRACELLPKSPVPRALLGLSYFQKGDFTSARRELASALRLNLDDSIAKLFLARSQVELGDLTSAVKLLEQLRQKDPHNVEALYSLGMAYSKLAEITLGDIPAADPSSYLLEYLLGKAAEAKGMTADAVEHYKKAIEKAPDASEDLYYNYAHVLWVTGDISNALAAYRHALSINSYDYRANWEAARIILPQDPQEAYTLANRSLELRPNVPEALTVRGRALLALKRPKEAVEDLRQASLLDPEDDATHFQLARAYRQLGMVEEERKENAVLMELQKKADEAMRKKVQKHLEDQAPKDDQVAPH